MLWSIGCIGCLNRNCFCDVGALLASVREGTLFRYTTGSSTNLLVVLAVGDCRQTEVLVVGSGIHNEMQKVWNISLV